MSMYALAVLGKCPGALVPAPGVHRGPYFSLVPEETHKERLLKKPFKGPRPK